MGARGSRRRPAQLRQVALARSWRQRFRPVLALGLLLGAALAVAGFLAGGQWKVVYGIASGIVLGGLAMLHDSPPARIQNRRRGGEGERKTARELRRLPVEHWKIWHDLRWSDGRGIGHVVVGRSGIHLLDSKDCTGQVTVDGFALHEQWSEDPDVTADMPGIFAKERGDAFGLYDALGRSIDVHVWVQPVVVIWGRFDQPPTDVNDVSFVRGRDLTRYFEGRLAQRRNFDLAKVCAFLDRAAAEGLGPRISAETPTA